MYAGSRCIFPYRFLAVDGGGGEGGGRSRRRIHISERWRYTRTGEIIIITSAVTVHGSDGRHEGE